MAEEDFKIFDDEEDDGKKDFFEEAKKADPETEAVLDTNVKSEIVTESPASILEDSPNLPQLCGSGYPPEYISMVQRVHLQYKDLPSLDYDAIYAELCDLSVVCRPSPSLQVINSEIAKVQGTKDRVSEIYVDVSRNYFFKKRAVDILTESWGRFTTEKNAEKRKGDCAFRLSSFELDFARVESLFKAVIHIIKNLDSLHDGLSRRITVYQSLLKLHDMGRGGLPNFDFKGGPFSASDEADDLLKESEEAEEAEEAVEIDPTESRPAELKDF